MLHWLFLFIYIFIILILSLIFLNKNLLSVILISDTILLITFTILSAISTLTNVYYLIPFAFFVLMLGGLELSLSLLLVLTQ